MTTPLHHLGRIVIAVCLCCAASHVRGDGTNAENAIMSKIKANDSSAILELGELDHLSTSTVEMLHTLTLEENKALASAAVNARMVLAKRGEQKYFDEIQNEILHGNPYEQRNAFQKLAYVGGAKSIMLIAPYLDRNDRPIERGPKDKVFLPQYAKLAIVALCKMVDHPPTIVQDVNAVGPHDIKAWRAWWKANREKYGQ